MEEQEKDSIKESVLSKIESGQIKMKPKWQFILKALFVIFGITLSALTIIFLGSFIFFVLRQNGLLFVPAFGLRGWGAFIFSLPWALILVSLIFLFILEILVRRYSFAYRKPILYSLVGIIVLVLLVSFVMSRVGLHQRALIFSRTGNLPIAGPLYRNYEENKPENVYFGEITSLNSEGFNMTGRNNEEFQVIFTPDTFFPTGKDFHQSDRVVVLGDRNGSLVTALGVREVSGVDDIFGRSRMMMGPMPPPPTQ